MFKQIQVCENQLNDKDNISNIVDKGVLLLMILKQLVVCPISHQKQEYRSDRLKIQQLKNNKKYTTRNTAESVNINLNLQIIL